MNSSLLSSSEFGSSAPLPTQPFDLESYAVDEATGFQDALGNVKAPKKSFKGCFEIIRRLGRGGFGTTYLATYLNHDAAQGRRKGLPCVIKQLKYRVPSEQSVSGQSAFGQSASRQSASRQSASRQNESTPAQATFPRERIQRRFQRETRMMARLGRHSQMPCLLDHFIEDDQFYLVQEHIPGQTISQEIARSGVRSEADVKQFLTEMLPILRYIHRQNLLHLDIKPSNIIRRSSDKMLVLIDFGAVRRYPDNSLNRVTERGSGTMGFAPSEQLAGKPTPASDIYALGVTCLYLLTKISPLDLAISPQGQNLRWQEAVQLSPHFTRILSKMLNPNHTRRFQSVDELERAMKLETHYDALQDCLNTAPLQKRKQPSVCVLPSPTVTEGNPIQRQATSIRQWKQRRGDFKAFVPR
ncbi:MAG: serine/threonine-protein kinase [Cyanobacteria bacterium P01_D01_bin.105]